MDFFTVSFFGHRKIINHFEAEKKLTEIIKELLLTKEYVEFLVAGTETLIFLQLLSCGE